MLTCPNCSSTNIHRSRGRSGWEYLWRQLTGKRPYRCHDCERRTWGPDIGLGVGEVAGDADFTRPNLSNRVGVSDFELDQLDVARTSDQPTGH